MNRLETIAALHQGCHGRLVRPCPWANSLAGTGRQAASSTLLKYAFRRWLLSLRYSVFRRALITLILVAVGIQAASPTVAGVTTVPDGRPSAEALHGSPDWAVPTTATVRARAMAWFEEQQVDQATRKRADRIWAGVSESSTAADRLAALAMTFALADARADKLIRFCAAPRRGIELPGVAWLDQAETQPLVSANLRLLVGRWLVHQSLYDEALQQLAGLEPAEVVDPASLLFYQAIAHHRLLRKQGALDAIDRLLDGRQHSPRRYAALARLMQEDLEGLSEDTLDHIARRMQDIERRLDLGRAGSKVRKIEDGVIESLDKLIEKLEKQQQQCQGGASNNIQSSRPAEDSRLMGGRGQGRVTRRRLGSKSGWGDLPPKEREEALQEIGRRFPSHYRDVIEQYFRKMAGEEP